MILLDFYRHLLLIVFFPAVFRVLTQRSFPVNSCFLSNYIHSFISLIYHLYLKKVLYLTALIIDIFQFLLFSLRFLNVMFTFHFITFSPKMTCSPIPSLASESLALASLLLLILSIAFSTIWTTVLNGLLLVDLKKAFDLVNHSILLSKLQMYGFSPSTVQWFPSYLSDRSQCTNVKGTLSNPLPVSIGCSATPRASCHQKVISFKLVF